MSKHFDPAKLPRCVNIYWRRNRKVRILSCPFGYKGKLGIISSVGAEKVYVRINLGKKPGQWDCVAYPPDCLRLV